MRSDEWESKPIRHMLATWFLGAVFGGELVLHVAYPDKLGAFDELLAGYALLWPLGRSFLIWRRRSDHAG